MKVNHGAKVVILCGACKGEDIQSYLEFCPKATIYAIEPIPSNYRKIYAKFGSHKKVIVVPKAAWIENGVKYMNDYTESMSHSFYKKPNSKFKEAIQVEVFDFSEFLATFNKVGILRMDIEGAEYEVLLKCFRLQLMDRIEEILIEVHSPKKVLGIAPLEPILRKELTAWAARGGSLKYG